MNVPAHIVTKADERTGRADWREGVDLFWDEQRRAFVDRASGMIATLDQFLRHCGRFFEAMP